MKALFNQRIPAVMTAVVLLAGSLFFSSGAAEAAVISNVVVNNYLSDFAGSTNTYAAYNTVDGAATESSSTSHWLSNQGDGTGSVTWFLNGRYSLSSIDVYNYYATPAFDSKNITVQVSNDYGQTYTTVTGPFTAAQSTGTGTNAATPFNLGGVTATNVRFNVTSGYGGNNYVGLNEVEFLGTPIHTSDQVPITVSAFSSQFPGGTRPASATVDGVFETTSTANMWLSNQNDNGGKPTITYSLGATPLVLDHLDIWNYNESGFSVRGLDTVRIELFNASMTSLGLAVNALDSTTTFSLTQAKGQYSATMDPLIFANAPAASFFEIETLSNPGTDNGFGGLDEVEAFAVPEPASAGLMLAGGVMLLRRRRV